jgi:hypothetical protein
MREALSRLGAPPTRSGFGDPQVWELDSHRLPVAVLARAEIVPDGRSPLRLVFDLPAPDGTSYISRTHPLVESVCGYLLDLSLDDPAQSIAKRAGAIRTDAVTERTTILVLRIRHLIYEGRAPGAPTPPPMLAEEVAVVGYNNTPDNPRWLESDAVETLIQEARPIANVVPQQAENWIRSVRGSLDTLSPQLDAYARERAAAVLEAHRRVRQAAGLYVRGQRVTPHLPPDILGIFVLMPPPVGAR